MSKGYWINRHFKDVFIEVLKRQHIGPKHTKYKIMWWNKGQCGVPYCMNKKQSIKVLREHYRDWSRFEF